MKDALERTVAANSLVIHNMLVEIDERVNEMSASIAEAPAELLAATAAPFSEVVPRPAAEVPLRLSRPSKYWAPTGAAPSSSSAAAAGFPGGSYGLSKEVAIEQALLGFVGFMDRADRAPEKFLDSICARLG